MQPLIVVSDVEAEDATVEDAMERRYFLAKVERGLDESGVKRSLMIKSNPGF